ncbi:MAG: leucyl aminopeptidase [Candidatus Eremiobacteraeota bacterium]|nr:leucyl aminopeptidase [Candidatus Eremiobacteraeota bacterium]
MQVRVLTDAPASVRAGALVLPVFAGADLSGVAKTLDGALSGAIADVLSSGEISGKPFELAFVHAKGQSYSRVLLVGLGEQEKFEPYLLARYAGAAVRYLGKRKVTDIAFVLPEGIRGSEAAAASFIVEGALTGTIDTTIYQNEPDRTIKVDQISILADGFDRAAVERGAKRGEIIGEAVNNARRMALTPANDMTPTHMAARARELAQEANLEIEVLDEDRMRSLGMGSLLSVAQGTDQPATMTILTYKGDPSSKDVLAFVGKGITFDSGGISIKPAEKMHEMKYDMSGGAAVMSAMSAIGRLRPKINVIGIVPATENLPGPRATKPGDIVRAMNGKTIEVINTDAEGRLILADGLCYANKLGATKIVDAATLTGSCVIALGHAASAAMGNDEAFTQQFLAAAKPTGERYWEMPLYEDYSTAVRSEIADLSNSAGRPAGTLTAGAFLKAFVDKTPWIHLDVAGTAYLDNESPWQAKGPTGTPVRAFVALAEALSESDGKVHPNGAKATVKAGAGG